MRPVPGFLVVPAALTLCMGLAQKVEAQSRPDPTALIAAQREAMKALAALDGIWRGPATTVQPSGEKHEMTQTERVGPFLDGSVRVIEGRSYQPDGRAGFNALATISFDTARNAYQFHSHAQGLVGDFVITPTTDGFVREIPAGPQTTIRYTAVVKGGEWYEVGDRVVGGQAPVRFFEMRLKRVGDTTWPAGDPVPPK